MQKNMWEKYGCTSATEFFIKLRRKLSKEQTREEIIRKAIEAEKKYGKAG